MTEQYKSSDVVDCFLCGGTGLVPTGNALLQKKIAVIIQTAAGRYGVTPADLISDSRLHEVVLARNEAIYKLRNELTMTLAAIGELLGGRCHTTIMNSLRREESKRRLRRAQEAATSTNTKPENIY